MTKLGAHSSMVSREVHRNAVFQTYDPEQAQALSDRRCRLAWKMTKRLPSLIRWVSRQLRDEWSPEQISGFRVSYEWIYSLIRDDKAREGNLWTALRLPQRRCYHRHLARRAGLGKIPIGWTLNIALLSWRIACISVTGRRYGHQGT